MFIKYVDATGNEKIANFKNKEEFLMLQMREVPTVQDHYKVKEVVIDDKVFIFSGNVGELFQLLNK